jgi:GxxExxY protein
MKSPMMNKSANLDDETEQLAFAVIGAAIEVHRELGAGLLEGIYEDSLCIELGLRNIGYERQKEISVQYKGHPVGVNYLDILVENRIILELKSVDRLYPVHTAQAMTYLKITKKRLALLINFNTFILKEGMKRIVI